MTVLPLPAEGEHTREKFTAFLEICRNEAQERARAQLVSITLESEHLDPLAVLDSIYEPGELHFYCERPAEHFAVAGAEAVVHATPEGTDRFAAARRFVDETLAHTIAVGDLDLPFAGPHFFVAGGFFDRAQPEFPFPATTIFVPRWQVGFRHDRFSAVANFVVAPDAEIEPLADKVWRASEKFRGFDYSHARTTTRVRRDECTLTEVGPPARYVAAVGEALAEIHAGRMRKVVVARAVEALASVPFHPLAVLNLLRQRFPDCYAFSVGNGRGQSFIGASPERLVRMRDGEVLTEALAGSAARGATAGEDAALAGGLLKSGKDLHEHALVVESLVRRLARLGLTANVGTRPRLRQISNVQHLHSPVTAPAPAGLHVLAAVAELHPTPAVGGTPREAACAQIPSLEPFARGLYAGPLGWADTRGEGEFLVGIRSALIEGARARLFAGNGIVAGSVPEKELAETEVKLRALLDALLA